MPLELLFLMCHCLLADDIATLAEVKVDGFPCKASATADDFFSSILAKPGATNTTSGSVVTGANMEKVPGLNTLGVSLSRIDYVPGGLNPPHTHPRATELVFVLYGTLDVGPMASPASGTRTCAGHLPPAPPPSRP